MAKIKKIDPNSNPKKETLKGTGVVGNQNPIKKKKKKNRSKDIACDDVSELATQIKIETKPNTTHEKNGKKNKKNKKKKQKENFAEKSDSAVPSGQNLVKLEKGQSEVQVEVQNGQNQKRKKKKNKKKKQIQQNNGESENKDVKAAPDPKDASVDLGSPKKREMKQGDGNSSNQASGKKKATSNKRKRKQKSRLTESQTDTNGNEEPDSKKMRGNEETENKAELQANDTKAEGKKKKRRNKKGNIKQNDSNDETNMATNNQVNDIVVNKEALNNNGMEKVEGEVKSQPLEEVLVQGKHEKEKKQKKKKRKKGKGESENDATTPGKSVEDESTLKKMKGNADTNTDTETKVNGSSVDEKKKRKKKKNHNAMTEKEVATDGANENVEAKVESVDKAAVKKKKKKVKEGENQVSEVDNEAEDADMTDAVDKKNGKQETELQTNTATKDSQMSDESNAVGNVCLNPAYSEPSAKEEISKHWVEDGAALKQDCGLEIIKSPFTCGFIPKFLKNGDFLKAVKKELEEIPTINKNNDLYKFKQTPDLKTSKRENIAKLREFLYGDLRKWLTEVTGIPLNETVDMGSSTYEYTDVLLCHDDELEGRRIAYILYLVPPWEAADGGTLDLFDTDENGQPKDVVRSLMPEWNAFAFFEVSPISFHQVAEVLSQDKKRLTINGWFHGPPIERPPKYKESPQPFLHPIHIEEDNLYSWINPAYLDEGTQRSIRKTFCEDSQIELESFICEEKFKELENILKKLKKKSWSKTGPANKKSYQSLEESKHPEVVKECLSFMRSEAMFLILSQLTGLKLHKLAPPDSDPDSEEEEEEEKEPNPRVRMSVQRWGRGSYTLIRDCDVEEQENALDATLFLNVNEKWTEELGGFNSYLSKDEDSELLSVLPRSNCLALVYRDADTLKFTKHINAAVKNLGKDHDHYFDIYCNYHE